MRNRFNIGFCLGGLLLVFLGIGSVSAVSPVVVGMVTDAQGNAYWQIDDKKKTIQVLAELPVDSTLVLSKGSKLGVVYLSSGQKYELRGPGIVQFKNTRPISLRGPAPKMVDMSAVSADKNLRIDPQKVQTAGQTLVSTDKQASEAMPVAAAAPPPPPPPAPSPVMPATVFTDVAASEKATAAEYERMQKILGAEAAAAAARAEVAETEEAAARKQAEEAAFQAAGAQETQAADAPVEDRKPACPPPSSDTESGQASAQDCSEIEN